MIRAFIPHRHRRLARNMDHCFERLIPLMGARVSHDERGIFISGFGSKAMSHRAAETPARWTRPWWDSQGAKLVFQALGQDRSGDRRLAALWSVEGADIEAEIIELARTLVPQWCGEVAAMR